MTPEDILRKRREAFQTGTTSTFPATADIVDTVAVDDPDDDGLQGSAATDTTYVTNPISSTSAYQVEQPNQQPNSAGGAATSSRSPAPASATTGQEIQARGSPCWRRR